MQTNSSATFTQDYNHVALEIIGRKPLKGEVRISGAKNSALAILAGTLLCSEECRLTNVPTLKDVQFMGQVLNALGVKIEQNQDMWDIDARQLKDAQAPYELVSQLRASFFVIGPILTRLGVAHVPLPGGCAIGSRPVDLHVRGLQAMGADVIIDHGIVNASVKGNKKRLQGANIFLDYPSVGATETIMMAATLAEGETIIKNAAQEPEIVDLANFCNSMGAKIKGAGTNTIIIEGVKSLHSTNYAVIPDRIEAGTFLVAGAITHSPITLTAVNHEHLIPVIAKLEEIGVKVKQESPTSLTVVPGELRATDIETSPHPGFPTDMQAQFMALLTVSQGNSLITETVFENRLRHVAELKRMGADIKVKGNCAMVKGIYRLSGAPVMATDLRASAALVIAALAADGTSLIQGLQHLDRGYENIEQKLQSLGAQIKRIQYLS
ncbi:UDP-N-acetylglucosamine 1-carboxyvinyltransferase [Cyanobacterium sp. IPPAS B-1200]|uniref:UDP-N-acetylglucosamine 1-carboxyvinyltransferase n=1 Tax=Cyanobacterium sp. IPPAS B-1200 TaxID=1562720 RepID=UPI00085266BD|nr:UDP-N-acetylglucosamine 1-carboxyvinyltransferase [Cyanobacterium sp. IPPAS B-1200]OEJ79970.1 UDP-N-acetylglucosamine 1-carboxyvinyltransferase [Cyanobacterium sp. IPPAS B-1200]